MPSTLSVRLLLLLPLFATAACASPPPPEGYERYFSAEVRFMFEWDDGETTQHSADGSPGIWPHDEEGLFYIEPGSLELASCSPLIFEQTGPVSSSGVISMELTEGTECSWETESGPLEIALDSATATWSRQSLVYSLSGPATWTMNFITRQGTVRITMAAEH